MFSFQKHWVVTSWKTRPLKYALSMPSYFCLCLRILTHFLTLLSPQFLAEIQKKTRVKKKKNFTEAHEFWKGSLYKLCVLNGIRIFLRDKEMVISYKQLIILIVLMWWNIWSFALQAFGSTRCTITHNLVMADDSVICCIFKTYF